MKSTPPLMSHVRDNFILSGEAAKQRIKLQGPPPKRYMKKVYSHIHFLFVVYTCSNVNSQNVR